MIVPGSLDEGAMDCSADLVLFNEVHSDLTQKNTVGWKNASKSLEAAVRHYQRPETQLFIARCFSRIISIMLDQHPSKIGASEKNSVVKSLTAAIPLIILQLKDDNLSGCCPILAMIFNKKRGFYKEYRASNVVGTYWSKSAGAPEVRSQCISLFCESNGFLYLYESLQRLSTRKKLKQESNLEAQVDDNWISAEDTKYLLHAIAEYPSLVAPNIIVSFCVVIMEHLSDMSNSDLKKESTESIGAIIQHIKRLMDASKLNMTTFFDLWLQLTNKYIHSSSLPLRLFGIEQLVGLIHCARASRPHPQKYIVRGAGVEAVNGVFNLSSDLRNDGARYTKQDPNGQIFTLFRCTMRSGCKWWFISEADKDQPGTDRDIDYYQHTSAYDEDIPPITHWNPTGKGVFPSPDLVPLFHDSNSGDDEQEQYNSNKKDKLVHLDKRLMDWMNKNEILQGVFGDRIHREIVSRSSTIVRFLLQMNALTKQSIDMIWKASLGKEEALVEEIHSLLAGNVAHMSDELLVHVLHIAKLSLSNNGITECIAFAEKLAVVADLQLLLNKGVIMTEGLLQLLWLVQQHPSIGATPPSENLVQFFNQSLRSIHGEGSRSAFLLECIESIQSSSAVHSVSSLNELDKKSSRALEMVKFLIETYEDQGEIIEKLDRDHQLVNLLFHELQAFTTRRSDKSSESYKTSIRHRLDLIRYIHGKSTKLDLSIEQIHGLWNVLSSVDEREKLFSFLTHSGLKEQGLDTAFGVDVYLHVFLELLCKQSDFSGMTDLGYHCFHTYFMGSNMQKKLLQKSSAGSIRKTASLDLLGIDALWRIALEAPRHVAECATKEILAVYDSLSQPLADAQDDFLRRVFQQLSKLEQDNRDSWSKIHHCLNLLSGFVMNTRSCEMSLAHGLSGHGNRYRIILHIQRISQSTHGASGCTEKPPRITFDVHARETLYSLRQRIESHLDHPMNHTKIMLNTSALNNDQLTLEQLHVVENSELRILLFTTMVNKSSSDQIHSSTHTSSAALLMRHPGDVLAENAAHFETLFRLLDLITEEGARASINDFLLCIPTNVQLSKKVQLAAVRSDETTDKKRWHDLLNPSSYHKSVYTMQIVDILLLPTMPSYKRQAEKFLIGFIKTRGFDVVLEFLMNDKSLIKSGQAVALRIVKYCLFDSPTTSPSSNSSVNSVLLQEVDYVALLDKLEQLVISEHKSGKENSTQIILDGLQTLQAVIDQTKSVAHFFTFENIKLFVVSILLENQAEKVRSQWSYCLQSMCKTSREAATSIYTILTEGVHDLDCNSTTCEEFFALLGYLVKQPNFPVERKNLGCVLVQKIRTGFCGEGSKDKQISEVITGCLQLLQNIIQDDVDFQKDHAVELIELVFDECLFAMPNKERKRWPLCRSTESRKSAFMVLSSAVEKSPTSLDLLVKKVGDFVAKASPMLQSKWGYEANLDMQARTQHVGLKNQGCSCYMNSFLQQLFMEKTIRNGILRSKLPNIKSENDDISQLDMDYFRKNPNRLIGFRVASQYHNGKVVEATVIDYRPDTGDYILRNEDGDVCLSLYNGKIGKEPGQFQLLSKPLSGDEATDQVLRELQRTFCFLRDSEMRFFNPKQFVEACKCLNLEFSVYQQNDASEFCDKLLDRLEIGLKKTPDGAKCLQYPFSGKLVSQKLPKGCGHRYDREEPFIRLELQIRGKESIEESLSAFVEGELMDGDNKVECEQCNMKKPAIRRTCFGTLPNLLVLHLKRFDLDYTTYETVKLNNRCSFPLKLNMRPYTKEGIEANELNGEHEGYDDSSSSAGDNLSDGESITSDPACDYELKGVLVHSGVAQGGHYFSFIQDRETGEWLKFDDEDVSLFDPCNIEAECFGGMQTRTASWHGVNNTMEMEVISNALMLFYEKVIPTMVDSTTESKEDDTKDDVCIYQEEVDRGNLAFMQNSYLLDFDYHDFLYDILTENQDNNSSLLQLGLDFVSSVIIHSNETRRDNRGVKAWMEVLQRKLEKNASVCQWFLSQLVGSKLNNWMRGILLECTDASARQSYADLVMHSISVLQDKSTASTTSTTLEPFLDVLTSLVDEAHLHYKTFEEFFFLIRDCCEKIPFARKYLSEKDMIARIVHLFLGDRSPPFLRSSCRPFPPMGKYTQNPDFQCLLECISALLGIPRRNTAPFLCESSTGGYSQTNAVLSPQATAAFTSLFYEFSLDGKLGRNELRTFFENSGNTIAIHRIETVLQKYSRGGRGYLDLSGFLSFYADIACSTSSKSMLADLRSYGFGDDLRRDTEFLKTHALSNYDTSHLPECSKRAIRCREFFEAALEEDADAASHLVVSIVYGDMESSLGLVRCVFHCIESADMGWKGRPLVDSCTSILTKLLSSSTDGDLSLMISSVLNGESGLLMRAEEKRDVTHPQALQLVFRLIQVLLELYKIPTVKVWLDASRSSWVWMDEWLRNASLHPALGGRPETLYREAPKLDALASLARIHGITQVQEVVGYLVEGAGTKEVNGLYILEGEWDGCPTYTYQNNSTKYTLFRCSMPSSARRWYISITPSSTSLGTAADIDFYYTAVPIEQVTPPLDNWKLWAKNSLAREPSPTVRLHTNVHLTQKKHQEDQVQEIRISEENGQYQLMDLSEGNRAVRDRQIDGTPFI